MRGLSDGVAVVMPLEGGPPGLSGALTGPIAVLYTPPVSASTADASIGLAIVTAPIPTSCSTRRRMMFMTCLRHDDDARPIRAASHTRVFFTLAAA
jgi:hypothetical protein